MNAEKEIRNAFIERKKKEREHLGRLAEVKKIEDPVERLDELAKLAAEEKQDRRLLYVDTARRDYYEAQGFRCQAKAGPRPSTLRLEYDRCSQRGQYILDTGQDDKVVGTITRDEWAQIRKNPPGVIVEHRDADVIFFTALPQQIGGAA